jgi:hypothetical protein
MIDNKYSRKIRKMARWVLENQNKMDYDDCDIEDLAEVIDMAIDNWMGSKDPRK